MNKPHDHSHELSPSSNLGSAFAWGVGLNLTFIAVEVVFGHLAGSVALVADAAHNFSDVLGLLLSWGAMILARQMPQGRYTYGYRSATILAVLASTLFLFVAVGGIVWSAIGRFGAPTEVQTGIVMVVATIGIGINGLSAWLLARGREDLNVKSAFIHLAGDAAISAGVVITGIVIYFSNWNTLDSLVSICISAVVLWSGWGVMRTALRLALNAVPESVHIEEVCGFLKTLPGVVGIHDVHVWPISTTEIALTAHLVIPESGQNDLFLHQTCHELHERFNIGHATLQIEQGEGPECKLEPDSVV